MKPFADAAALLGADRDVLEVGLGRGEPAGRRDQLVERRVDPAVVGDGLEEPLDRLPQPGDVAVAEQVAEELGPLRALLDLGEQTHERVGVGGVAGLGALGLRHAELVEQDDLELLGRAEVDLLADRGVRRLGRQLHATGELRLQRLQVVDVDGDAGLLHQRQQVDERQLHLGQQPGAAALLDLGVEGVGEVDDRAGVQHRGVGGVGGHRLVERVEGQLAVVGGALLQLALEVAQGQVGQVVGALVGAGEVRRQGGVADQSPQRPAARRQREHRALRVVQHLGVRGVVEPRHHAPRRPRASPRRRRTTRPCRRPRPAPPTTPRRCRSPSGPGR